MKYYSLNKQSPNVDFKEATIKDRRRIKDCIFLKIFQHRYHLFLKTLKIFRIMKLHCR